MKRLNKIISGILVLIFILPMTFSLAVGEDELLNAIGDIDYSEEFKIWNELPEDEKENSLIPQIYNIPNVMKEYTNPIKVSQMVGNSNISRYSLEDDIPENVVVRDQKQTNGCWAFSSLGSLESTLGLANFKNGMLSPKAYDFSERHMDYATRRKFNNGKINYYGLNRDNSTGGNYIIANNYLVNGLGPIAESEMPLKDDVGPIDIDEIKNKKVLAEVSSLTTFPQYREGDSLEKYKNLMKNHIKQYGALQCMIHGASPFSEYLNNDTGAMYCDNKFSCPINHGVIIIGWDDNYSRNNFNEKHRPKNNGAWIVKNSWGEEVKLGLKEMKETCFKTFKNELAQKGIYSPEQIPDDLAKEVFKESGFEIKGNNACKKVGDKGKMYVSYDDVNIYTSLEGFKDVSEGVSYDHLYAYDKQFAGLVLPFNVNNIFLAEKFDKATNDTEYVTKIGLTCSETTEVKVYINKNNDSIDFNNYEPVETKYGKTVTVEPGYNTIEFKEPIRIDADKFGIILDLKGERSNQFSISTESVYPSLPMYDEIDISDSKCFWTLPGEQLKNNVWVDLSTLKEFTNGRIDNGDSTVKVYTVDDIKGTEIKDIKIAKEPDKLKYKKGEDFNTTGMKVVAIYDDNSEKEITDYVVVDGENLETDQTTVTIKYRKFTCKQSITVESTVDPEEPVKKEIKEIKIVKKPNKLNYFEGENFDSTGMEVDAIYNDGTTKEITDYVIVDGKNLKVNQKYITIEYKGLSCKQLIDVTVNKNPDTPDVEDKEISSIRVLKEPDKLKYTEGENFDRSGMKVEAIYKDGSKKEISDYIIKDGKNLKVNQEYVTIEYKDLTCKQFISVSPKIEPEDPEPEKPQPNLKPETSKVKNIKAEARDVSVYSTPTIKPYWTMNMTVPGIERPTSNDSMEYYYFLSGKRTEENITEWEKIKENQTETDKISFRIDTRDISYFKDIVNEDDLYLYIKEVAKKGDNVKQLIIKAIPVKIISMGEIKVETNTGNKDDIKKPDNNSNNNSSTQDDTKAENKIPNAGKAFSVITLVVIVASAGAYFYIRYKKMDF